MSTATELLKRALKAWDLTARSGEAAKTFEKIRAFLAAEPEAELTKIEIEAERQDIDWQSNEGAVYLFAGWLTTRDKVISCGRTENASPMAEAIKEYKAEWPERFTKPAEPAARKPMTEEEMDVGFSPYRMRWLADDQYFVAGVRWAEKHHGITE